MSSITLTAVYKSFGKNTVVSDFSAVFQDHEFVTLLGPSGCGKTTLLRLIAGFEKPSSGEIKIDDRVVSSSKHFVPANRRGIGMVFQSYAVWPHMTVFENVAYPLTIEGRPKAEISQRVADILDAVHLGQLGERFPHELSGGQQQRVALGRALVSNPHLLLLDEPLSNLDAKLRESMRYEILDVQKKSGITVVYVTHDQMEAMAMSDRVIILNKGKIQQVDTPIGMYRHPANQFVADFVGKSNFLHGVAEKGRIYLNNGQMLAYSGEKQGPVIVAVRPEHISIRNDHGTYGTLQGQVKHSCYLGDIVDYSILLQTKSTQDLVRVTAPGHTYGQIHDGASVSLDIAEYLVFCEEKEEREGVA
ncbi:MAG: ABC transporter ATP-binding protein [Desulfovibrionaceae bacterium]|nr:ABC transporter ATP-binding protein [Desulfovibrionaceae bacterium]